MVNTAKTKTLAKKQSRTQRAKAAVRATVNNLLADTEPSEVETEAYETDAQIVSSEPIDFNLTPQQSANNISLDFSRLPLDLRATVPDFAPLMGVTDLSKPESFQTAGYGRVTDNQREIDKVGYKEHKNFIDNIGDGLDVLLSTANAAIKAAKLGQAQVKYSTAREGISTELNNLKIQQSKTRQGALKVEAELDKEAGLKDTNTVNKSILDSQVEGLRLTLQEYQSKHKVRQQSLAALIGTEVPST